jgi:hypothetical protein
VPTDDHWLQRLCQPILDGQAEYTYGRQVGGPDSHFSECRIFAKYYPERSRIPQDGFFCNNANSALLRSAWEKHHFDEELTGLEDMELAQRLVRKGGRLAYVADARSSTITTKAGRMSADASNAKPSPCKKSCRRCMSIIIDTLRYVVSPASGKTGVAPEGMKRWGNQIESTSLATAGTSTWLLERQPPTPQALARDKEKYFFPH